LQQIAYIRPQLVCSLGNWATQTLLERKVGITKVRGQVFRLERFVLFPLLHPAAALHQGNMLEPLRQDFKKLREFLDRQTKVQADPVNTGNAPARPMSGESPPPAQMDLFG
jgi:DNA polymerase